MVLLEDINKDLQDILQKMTDLCHETYQKGYTAAELKGDQNAMIAHKNGVMLTAEERKKLEKEAYQRGYDDCLHKTKCIKGVLTSEDVPIGQLSPGTTIEIGDVKMDILDTAVEQANSSNTGVLCLSTDVLRREIFDEASSDWAVSDLRTCLDQYEREIDPYLAASLLPIERDLTSDEGLNVYGACADLISIISCDEYRKYRNYISSKTDYWWTLTPVKITTDGKMSIHEVRSISPDGVFYNRDIEYNLGVCPLFLINPSTKVKVFGKGEN